MGELREEIERLSRCVWNKLGDQHRQDFKIREDTITESLLLELKKDGRSKIIKFNQIDEGVNGADWEWWLYANNHKIGFRVQAKILFHDTLEYESLYKDCSVNVIKSMLVKQTPTLNAGNIDQTIAQINSDWKNIFSVELIDRRMKNAIKRKLNSTGYNLSKTNYPIKTSQTNLLIWDSIKNGLTPIYTFYNYIPPIEAPYFAHLCGSCSIKDACYQIEQNGWTLLNAVVFEEHKPFCSDFIGNVWSLPTCKPVRCLFQCSGSGPEAADSPLLRILKIVWNSTNETKPEERLSTDELSRFVTRIDSLDKPYVRKLIAGEQLNGEDLPSDHNLSFAVVTDVSDLISSPLESKTLLK